MKSSNVYDTRRTSSPRLANYKIDELFKQSCLNFSFNNTAIAIVVIDPILAITEIEVVGV